MNFNYQKSIAKNLIKIICQDVKKIQRGFFGKMSQNKIEKRE